MKTLDECKEAMGIYWETSEGWDSLLDGLYLMIGAILEKHGAPLTAVKPTQIKSKFGGLRFYYDTDESLSDAAHEEVDEAVTSAESASLRTCEYCGEEGDTCCPRGYWIVTLCPQCKEKSE